jgi:hypothetical protein
VSGPEDGGLWGPAAQRVSDAIREDHATGAVMLAKALRAAAVIGLLTGIVVTLLVVGMVAPWLR